MNVWFMQAVKIKSQVSHCLAIKSINKNLYLKDFLLMIFPEIVCKHISVHECPPALTQNIQGLLQELDLNPGHVVLLHLLHLVLHHGVQLALKLQGLQVVHVSGQKLRESCGTVFNRRALLNIG